MTHFDFVQRPLTALSRWWIVVLLMGFAALGHFNRVGISVIGTEVFIRDGLISQTDMGLVYTAFLITYTLGMIPAGWLIDRVGSVRAMMWYGLSMGIFVVATGMLGFQTSTTQQLWMSLIVIRSLAGMCSAPLHPGAAHVVSTLVPPRGRATANGMVTAGAVIGIAGCYPLVGWMKDEYGWPWACVISGVALILFAGFWRWNAHYFLSGHLLQSHTTTAAEPGDTGSVLRLFLRGSLWLVTLSYAAYGYFQYLFFYWTEYYFEQVLKFTDVHARNATSVMMIAMSLGMAAGGFGTDVVCRKLGTMQGRRLIAISGMGLSALFAVIAANLNEASIAVTCLSISMAALGMCEGVFWTSATDIGGKLRGLSGGFMNAGGNVGGFISPTLSPILANQLGWPGAIAVACAINAFGGLLWFLVRLPESPNSQSKRS